MLIQRIVTAGVFGAAVVAAVLYLPSLWVGVLLGALWLVGVREWASFARLGSVAAGIYVAGIALLMLLAGMLIDTPAIVGAALVVAGCWWLVVMLGLTLYPRRIPDLLTMLAGVATLLPAWILLAWLHSTHDRGPVLILTLLAVVWAADTGAFFAGRTFGRHKLAPQVSPGKTWEGVVGGLLLAAVVGALAGALTRYGALDVAVVALASAALSIVGDLNVSMFKRNAGLKDSGRLLPGHGGVLDRVDSVTAAVAMFVLGLSLVGIIT